MEAVDRHRRLDEIGRISDELQLMSRRYDRLRWLAEQPLENDVPAPDMLIDLAWRVGAAIAEKFHDVDLMLTALEASQRKRP